MDIATLQAMTYAFGKGIIDSLRGIIILNYLDKEMDKRSVTKVSPSRISGGKNKIEVKTVKPFVKSRVRMRFIHGCGLNLFIFLLSLIIFNYGALPAIKGLLMIFIGSSSSTSESETPNGDYFMWNLMEWILSRTFEVCWVVPIFSLTKIINFFWFQDIADSCFRFYRGRPQSISSISKSWADALFNVSVQCLFLVQCMIVNMLPLGILSEVLSMVHICLLYSLYAFEYKWCNMGWELHRRLTFIENHWPYFIGFGLPLAALTQLTSSLYISGSIFSAFFPIFIISGNEATPITNSNYPVRLFSPVVAINNCLFNLIIKQLKSRAEAQKSTVVR